LAALLGAVVFGGANTLMKSEATNYENDFAALMLQYSGVAIAAVVAMLIASLGFGQELFPVLDGPARAVLVGVGIVGFAGIAFLYQGFNHLPAGVVMIVANLMVFLAFFANVWLFGAEEQLSLVKIILAILYFVVIAQFLRGDESGKFVWRRQVVFPFLTAICRTIFFVGNTRFVKNAVMTPVQSVFSTELAVFAVALPRFFLTQKLPVKTMNSLFKKSHFLSFLAIGGGIILANFLFYFAYLDTPANLVNFVRLFSVVVTAILAWIFLKDSLSKRSIVLMSIALLLLVAFLFV